MESFEHKGKQYLKPEDRLVCSYKEIYILPLKTLRGSVIVQMQHFPHRILCLNTYFPDGDAILGGAEPL